jgi:sugar phosphate permease
MKSMPEEEPVSLYSWVVAVLCMATYAVSFLCRNAWQVAIPEAVPALNLSMTAAGGLMTAFYAGYVASNFLTGPLVDGIGPRKMLAAASLFTGLFTILIPFSANYSVIVLLRVGAGIASGPLFAGVVKFQLAWFTKKFRATAMGFMFSGVVVGDMIAAGVFAPIIDSKGWETGFTYAGAITLIFSAVFYLFAKERGLALTGRVKKEVGMDKKGILNAGLLAVVKQRSFVIGTLACFLNIGAFQGFTTFLLLYLTKAHALSLPAAGALYAGTTSVGLVSGTLAGIISDWIGSRKKACYLGATGAALTTIALLYTTNVTMLVVALVLRRLIGSLFGIPLNTLQAETAAGPYAGRAMGIYNGTAQLGSVVFPLAMGSILDITSNDFFYVFTTVAVIHMICGLLVILMKETAEGSTGKTGGAAG